MAVVLLPVAVAPVVLAGLVMPAEPDLEAAEVVAARDVVLVRAVGRGVSWLMAVNLEAETVMAETTLVALGAYLALAKAQVAISLSMSVRCLVSDVDLYFSQKIVPYLAGHQRRRVGRLRHA